MKSLKEISWNVTEEEYRKDKALSYSTLARFEREGFDKLDSLFDRIETPSLTFGSAVDSIITGGIEEFNERFIVAEFPKISESLEDIAKTLFLRYGESYRSISQFPDALLAETGKERGFYAGDKYAAYRVKLIREGCENYYSLMTMAEGKTVLSSSDYEDVRKSVEALKTSPSTRYYFAEDNPFENIERCYQLKFKSDIDGIGYRCMADLLLVNHDKKVVVPVDLKTSSKSEWDFYKSFIQWNYSVQARLYWRVIRENMDKDDYFKDFELKDYRFIVVNRRTLVPLVWDFPLTKSFGELSLGRNKQIILRDPFAIGKELNDYLKYSPKTPNGINTTESNNLVNWINTL